LTNQPQSKQSSPVLLAAVSFAVADNQHRMIHVLLALGLEVVARLVELERVLTAINSSSNWTDCKWAIIVRIIAADQNNRSQITGSNGLLERFLISNLNLHVGHALAADIFALESARAVGRLVRVRGFGVHTRISRRILVGIRHVAAIASIIICAKERGRELLSFSQVH
jgi:hypothetical protein